MTEVTLVKRLIVLGAMTLLLMTFACTKEKPLDVPTPVAVQVTTAVPNATTTPTATAAPLVPVVTETPLPAVTLVVPTITPTPIAPLALGTPTMYTVQWGDWLRKIAEKHGVSIEAIIAANPGINPNVIYPGQVLKIPAPSGTVPTPVGFLTPVVPSSGPTTYTVQRGEWFYQIARKFGISVAQLQAANPGVNPNFLYPGQVLNIPGDAAPYPTPGVATATPGTGATQTYTVQAGDTLYAIAVRFHTTTYALQIANHLPNANAIYPGMVLIIPSQ